jgi:hypothetical protein
MVLENDIINWLMDGDESIQYQTRLDLLDKNDSTLQKRIERKGWGLAFLRRRKPDGHWGYKFYQPKWTSSHYTLLDLRNLYISPEVQEIKQTIELIIHESVGQDGGINPAGSVEQSDVCINGMFLNYASYFKTPESLLKTVVDYILDQGMPDGGFNCRLNRSGAKHSSMHSTISVLEGIIEYKKNGYSYRVKELETWEVSGREFLLEHRLFKSDKTGEIIHPDFMKLHYPYRWRYDVLRALDYFRYAGLEWDNRLTDAIDLLMSKRQKSGKWNLNARYPGKIHFEMEPAGQPSRWNTLRALRVLKHFKKK